MGKSEVVGLAWQRCGIRRESEMEKETQTRPHETKLSRVVGSAERPGGKARSSKEDERTRNKKDEKSTGRADGKSAARAARTCCVVPESGTEATRSVGCRWSVEIQHV